MRIYNTIFLTGILICLFAMPTFGVVVDLTLNQYYDIETGDLGSNNASMDFYCSQKTQSYLGKGHEITPANNAWQIQISSNLTNVIGYIWSKNKKALNNNYIFTTTGNYARIHSSSSEDEKCQFNKPGTGDSLFNSTPFFKINNTDLLYWTEFQTKTHKINDSAGVGIRFDSLGVFPHNFTTVEVSQNFDSVIGYNLYGGAVYTNMRDTTRSPWWIAQGADKQISYFNKLNCPGALPYTTSVNVTNLNEVGVTAICVYPKNTYAEPLSNDGSYLMKDNLAILHLDEDGSAFPTFIDSSGNNNHGACIQGDCTTRIKGIFNSGQSFNYTAQRAIGLANLTENPIDFSVSFWANPDRDAYIPDMKQTMATKSSSWLIWQTADDLPFIWVWDQDFTLYTLAGTHNITGAWHHITITMDNNTNNLKLYIDGVIDGTLNLPSYDRAYPNNEAIYLGLMSGGDQLYNGYLDEFAYWNRTLNASEINQLYNKKSVTEFSDLGGAFMINETGSVRSPYNANWADWRINLAYYNLSQFNIIYSVTRQPQDPRIGDLVWITWLSSLESDGYLYYRFAPFNSTNYTVWYSFYDDVPTTIHKGYINNTLDKYTYQYYVTAGSANDTNNGLYYNYTVGSYASFTDKDKAIIKAMEYVERSGFCTGSSCFYILGIILTIGVTAVGFYIGGLQIGILFLSTCIGVFPLVGLLPIELLIPLVVIIALWLATKFGLLGGGE